MERHGVSKSTLIVWRKQKVITRVERPTKLARAHSLGYKAKQGFIVARVRVDRGSRKKPKVQGGRKPKTSGKYFTLGKPRQQVAEEKAARKYPNLNVLNSYYVAEDGMSRWFEVILVDTTHPSVLKDKDRNWIALPQHTSRANRGLTSSGKKSRGLR